MDEHGKELREEKVRHELKRSKGGKDTRYEGSGKPSHKVRTGYQATDDPGPDEGQGFASDNGGKNGTVDKGHGSKLRGGKVRREPGGKGSEETTTYEEGAPLARKGSARTSTPRTGKTQATKTTLPVGAGRLRSCAKEKKWEPAQLWAPAALQKSRVNGRKQRSEKTAKVSE